MMRCSPFDFSGFYNSPGYYYGYQPNYARTYGVGQPFVETMPYLSREYGMPVEIPVIHEGYDTSLASERKSNKAMKPRIPEEETVGPDTMVRKETGTKKQPSPTPIQKKPSSMPYGTRQVPVNNMESSDSEDTYDDEFSYFYPEASSEMYEDRSPFGNGFPFLTSSRRSPLTKVPHNKATSQRAAATSAHKQAEKCTPKKTTATTVPQTGSGLQRHEKVRQVPIVMETVQHASVPQRPKLPLTVMEQLENIQKEVEVIENRVENFSGDKKDKEYIILDEMMTSLLLKLDMIESNGIEEIRNKRRQLVKHIQEYVQKLECKVGIVSPAEETTRNESEIMEVEDEGKTSKEEMDPEVSDEAMNSQSTVEEQTRALDLDSDKASSAVGSGHHDGDQSPRLEGEMQSVSSLQEMVVDNSEIECNCTSQTDVNSEVANRTSEQVMAAGDAIRTTGSNDVETITDLEEVGDITETNFKAVVPHCSENCHVANDN